jgi:seryl-tRNA synthetase
VEVLDIKFIRQNPELVKAAIGNKGEKADIDAFLALDERRREIIAKVEQLKAERNAASQEISKMKKSGADATAMIEKMRGVGDEITVFDKELQATEEQLNELLLWFPNMPHSSVPIGKTDSDNVEIKKWGEPRKFDFQPRPHWEIGEIIGGIDFRHGAAVSGSGFYFLTGPGARLERALINFMLDLHTTKHGYTEVMVPYIVGRNAMRGTGQVPKLADDMSHIEKDDLFLIPTAEVSLTNLRADEILRPESLPLKFVAFSPCFRRESGSYGKETRGIVRVHQFHKVEMVKIVEPETSYDELESLRQNAEAVLEMLGLTYRVRVLCTGDL